MKSDHAVILLTVLLMVGNNYAFDIPQALENPMEKEFHLTQTQFNLMYSIFAIPNIGLSIGGGMMIDRMGGRWGVFAFSLILAMSQLAVYLGAVYRTYSMMLLGRALFGISSDMLHIAVYKIIARRMPDQMGSSMGLILTIPELAAALNSILSPFVFKETHSIDPPLLLGLIICCVSFICGLLMIYIDLQDHQDEEVETEIESKPFECNRQFVIMAIICTFLIGAYVPFYDNANKFYRKRFGFSQQASGNILTIGYIVAALSSPIVGSLSDSVKNRKPLVIITTLVFLSAHLQLYSLPQGTASHPDYFSVLALVTLGIAYSCYSAILMPAFQESVPESVLATALGIYGVAENVSMAMIPLLSGYVYSLHKSMKDVDLIYILLAGAGTLLAFQYNQKQKVKDI